MLQRKPSLTDQARIYIRERILNREFADDRIPSETLLAEELGVSRTTIRDALTRLENDGVITRRQGAGTFVTKAGLQIRSRLDEIWSYEGVLRAHCYTPSTRLVSFDQGVLDPLAAKELELPADATFLTIEKLFLQDSEPVIFTRNFIPEQALCVQPTAEDLQVPVFDFLRDACRQRLTHYLTDLVPTKADDDLSLHLGIPAGTPLLSLEEIGYSDAGDPIFKACSYFRDDLLRFRLIRREAS